MSSSNSYGLLVRGFLSGAVVTASISYSLYLKKVNAPGGDGQTAVSSSKRFPFGTPRDISRMIEYAGHTLYYDAARKQPVWVAELLNKDSMKGKANRKRSKFQRDDKIPMDFASANSDFHKSGWSRGHMAPAGNCKFSQDAMDDTFYLTNIVPQDFDNNSGFWNRLEIHCRDLTKKYQNVHVITGPIYKPNKDVNGKTFVEYEVIGQNRIPVPTHLFKIVTAYDDTYETPAVGAFVVPNRPIDREVDELRGYQVSLHEVQKLTGFLFNPELSADRTTNLCVQDSGNCKLKNWKISEIYFAGRKLENARSQKDIDYIMAQFRKNGIEPDQKFMAQLNQKQAQLQMSQVR